VNKIGIYYAYWCKNWDADFYHYVKKVSELGFDICELNSDAVLAMSKNERQKVKEVSKKENIELTFCMGLANEYDISVPDKSIRENGIEYLKRNIEMIYEMGSNQLSGILYAAWNPILPEKTFDKVVYRDRSIESMKEVIETAQNYGVYCNIEVVNRYEQFILNTCNEAIEYVNMVDSPNIRILLDTYHMNIEEDSIETAIINAGDKLGHLHIGENNRKPPGRGGHLNWQELFSALAKIGYTGNIVMEPFVREGGEIGEDIRIWRNLLNGGDMDKEAKAALEFIKSIMKKYNV
jgi:D-psicose/D-tagatose/L-ribulose 3-epimerase